MNSNDKPLWYSPVRVLYDYTALVSLHGADIIHEKRKYKKVIEARAVAALCLGLYETTGHPWFMQMSSIDPPDSVIMRLSPNDTGTLEKVRIEVTGYFQHNGVQPKETLLEQLKKTKIFSSHHKYDATYAILVEVGYGYEIDYWEIHTYLNSIDAPYQVWIIQYTSYVPDTIIQIATCTHGYGIKKINISQSANSFINKVGINSMLAARVGNIGNGNYERSAPVTKAVWE